MEKGLVFNIQKYSIQDGPGIRTTVFLKGCPLQCWWCHNPESQAAEPEVAVIESRCAHCGECRTACPNGLAAERCVRCGQCVAACPTGARQLIGREMSADEVLAEALKDRIFYESSGGGVTFSGGEPLAQAAFLTALLEASRRQGLRTAVDTCGYAPRKSLLAIAPLTDLFLYDLKLMDDQRHRQYTGVSNVSILENLKALGRVHGNIWLRVPLIPGINDAPEDLDALARCAASIAGVRQVNLLAYHEGGVYKSRRVGRTYRLPKTEAPTPEEMERAAAVFKARGLNVKKGG